MLAFQNAGIVNVPILAKLIMNIKDVVVGQKVLCVHHTSYTSFYGLVGVIDYTYFARASNYFTYQVQYDNNKSCYWSDLDSHETVSYIALKPISNLKNMIASDFIINRYLLPPEEAPCKVCSKMNDLGVNKCWNCETINPC